MPHNALVLYLSNSYIGRIAFYATFWSHGRVYNIMKVLYLDPCLKIRYTFLIDCGVTCLRGFHLSLQEHALVRTLLTIFAGDKSS